jgi:hypothetical protein
MPISSAGNASNNAGTTSVIKQTQVVQGSGLLLETNGVKNADQSTLNIIGEGSVTAAVDSNGNLTLTGASSASTPSIPLPNSAVFFLARAVVNGALQTIGDSSTGDQSGNGTINNGIYPAGGLGVVVTATAGSIGGGGYVGWYPINSQNNLNGIFTAGRNNRYQARLSTASITDVITFAGFSTATPSSMRTFPFIGASDYVGLYTPGVGSGDNWHATINGTVTDTGAPITGNDYLELIMDDTANTTSFSVNGSTPVVISGMNPSGFNWFPTVTFAVNASAAVGMSLEYFYAQQDY